MSLALAGCAVGPDFVKPAAPDVHDYTSPAGPVALEPGSGEASQRLVSGRDIAADWWTLFESRALNDVIDKAVVGSRTLAAAKATLAQAEQVVLQERGAYYPQLDLAVGAERHQASRAGGGTIPSTCGPGKNESCGSSLSNLFKIGPTVSYSPDVFGATRRRVEQSEALAENQRYQLVAAELALTGNTVAQAITIAGLRLQQEAAGDIVAQDERTASLVRRRYQAGKVAQAEVLVAESQLANDRTQLPPLHQQLSVARDALVVLVGEFPGRWSPPDFELSVLRLPSELPVRIASDLVRQRPDILAAESELHAASAEVGVTIAQMYPSITLSASAGYGASTVDGLFQGSSLVWGLVSGISAPIFHGGALEAQKKAAMAAFDASLATYQQVVLQAFGQVADTLRALQNDSDLVDASRRALDTATASLALQQMVYDAGKSDLLLLLTAQRAYQQARLVYARAEAQRYQDTALLFVAMGGGWWNAPPPA